LLFVFLRARASTPPAEERVTSLACPREVTKRRAPRTSRSTGILPFDCARGLRGLLDVRPCTCRKLACLLHAIANATFPPPAGRDSRGPMKSGALLRAEATATASKLRRSCLLCALALPCALALLCLSLLRAGCALLSGPRRRGEAVEDQARRGTRTMRVLRRTHMNVRPANPGAASRTRSTGTVRRARPTGACFLLVTFLCTSKEK